MSSEDQQRDSAAEAERVHLMLRECFSTEAGQETLAWLCKTSGVTHPVFSLHIHETYFNEGKRHLVTSILKALGRPEDIIKRIIKTQEQNHEDII